MSNEDSLPFELCLPAVIKLGTDAATTEANLILRGVTNAFADAVISLIYFEQAQAASYERSDKGWSKEVKERYIARVIADADIPFFERQQKWTREDWAEGRIPRHFTQRLQLIYAKAFIYAADNIGKFFAVLGRTSDMPSGCAGLAERYYADFPSLKEIRDSAQHIEDRLRKKARIKNREVDIESKPLNIGPVSIATTDGLINNSFSTVLADGHQGMIDLNRDTLTRIRNHVQKAFDLFTSDEPPRYFPFYEP